jgi:hypothetical protein
MPIQSSIQDSALLGGNTSSSYQLQHPPPDPQDFSHLLLRLTTLCPLAWALEPGGPVAGPRAVTKITHQMHQIQNNKNSSSPHIPGGEFSHVNSVVPKGYTHPYPG